MGTVNTQATITGALASATEVDWYKFTTTVTGNASSYVQLSYVQANGRLVFSLYSNPWHAGAVASPTTTTNLSTISLKGLPPGTYYVRVAGYAANSYTINVVAAAPVLAPAAPTGLTAGKGASSSEVTLSWNASLSATAYDVYRNTTNNSATATQINASDLTTTTYNDTTAVAGTTYYYWVKAKNTAGSSGFSNSDSGYVSTSTVLTTATPDNTPATANQLGTLTGTVNIAGSLASASAVDWFEFTLSSAGSVNALIRLQFVTANGKLLFSLYKNPLTQGPIGGSTAGANQATLSIAGLAKGTYYIRVAGYAANSYTLSVTP